MVGYHRINNDKTATRKSFEYKTKIIAQVDLRRRKGRKPSLYFAITLTNYVLFEVQLIINKTPLTYFFYPNTIETCLTPNNLLFCRQYYILLKQHQL